MVRLKVNNLERKIMAKKPKTIEQLLATVINDCSRENDSNTPDFILARFMMDCLGAFEFASNKREVWYDIELDINNDWKELIMQAIGKISMCWSNIDKAGTFDSVKAQRIGLKLLANIKKGK